MINHDSSQSCRRHSLDNELVNSLGLPVPPPVALARLTDNLTPPGVREYRAEPKFDGYRAVWADGRLYSRRATDLTRLFPDLVPVLRSRLPSSAVFDGELVVWNTRSGRLDFAALQARITAGRRIHTVAAQHPAHYVIFDVLAADGRDVRPLPLTQRRALLEELLRGAASPIVLCDQTDDSDVARRWMDSLTVAGLEGVVIKDGASPYPTRDGVRAWWKVKAKTSLDLVVIGYTGAAAGPTSLVLAFPGVLDEHGQPVTAGATTVLSKSVARSVARLLRPTGASFTRSFVWGGHEPSMVTVVEPLVVEVQADASAQAGVLRHAARLVRARPDLRVEDILDTEN